MMVKYSRRRRRLPEKIRWQPAAGASVFHNIIFIYTLILYYY